MPKLMRNKVIKLAIVIGVLAVTYFLLWYYGVTASIALKNVYKIKEWVSGFGIIAPLIYIGFYIVATLFFLPGLPITVLSGIVFGPVWGVVYVWISATVGVSLAFLVARYVARGLVENWVSGNDQFRRIDEKVEQEGWRILMFTRLVPIFPFNLQNYAYGLTKIKFHTYVLVSSIFMLPGTIAYVQIGGALVSGEGNLDKTLIYLSIAGVLIVLVSLIPKFLRRHQPDL
ncbi:MAG: TVP38/TMEM64 family protein [Candidatus Poribacteria bacterium]|nr:TVP38/TMEM64 family protein [Candidatus Poribacteria bacterium]